MIIFRNRVEAAKQLADMLFEYRGLNPLILAISDSAVPMGQVLARKLKGQLDVAIPYSSSVSGCGRIVILVDDGIMASQMMLAAVKATRADGPCEIVVTTPVASAAAYCELEQAADKMVVFDITLEPYSVSLFYINFPQVSDEEIVRILAQHQWSETGTTQQAI